MKEFEVFYSTNVDTPEDYTVFYVECGALVEEYQMKTWVRRNATDDYIMSERRIWRSVDGSGKIMCFLVGFRSSEDLFKFKLKYGLIADCPEYVIKSTKFRYSKLID